MTISHIHQHPFNNVYPRAMPSFLNKTPLACGKPARRLGSIGIKAMTVSEMENCTKGLRKVHSMLTILYGGYLLYDVQSTKLNAAIMCN